ncbi:sigma-70 family RNA polymerase sigma factor [Ammoniphilus sp. CFH 90114]|uniref:sigma-70 family RNA polymerase sigma factor n=1 Tax=Ammoniphilus sp. CFH 90114 TaxID=2493665 RepID=UPI00100E644B|nr:sigma-70 family RNA polymerase sigma factor [Ammoniphilus sp. CFH 90114]RXT15394.1 sigma-70 family RNA polymerase sigma factor [Ammoniphilus sp. CFH 90114]
MDDSNELHELVRLTKAGNHEAFGELYEKTIKQVNQTVHFLVEHPSDREDVIQEAYIGLHKSLGNYDINRPFKPWLMGIVIKQVNTYRRKRWMTFRIINKKSQEPMDTVESDVAIQFQEKLIQRELIEEIKNLSYKLKQVVILHYLNEYTQEEVAKILNIPIGTVKSRINAALKKLREKKKPTLQVRKVEAIHELRTAHSQRTSE